MNDLRTLGAALAQDEPAQDVVDRSRHRLQNHMRGHRPIRRRAWLAVTAAAAAAAVAVALPAGDPPSAPSGRDILLAAADAAERSPEGSGTYWYYKVEEDSHRWEFWIRPDGQSWYRYGGGEIQQLDRLRHPFSLLGVPMTLDQLRALPTEPEALRAWIDEALADYDGGFKERNTLDALISLVSMLPAPPEVRAAAFRAIAAYPGVEYLGDVPGGKGVRLPSDGMLAYAVDSDGRPLEQRLVVDPATGRANGTTFFVNGAARIIAAEPGARITAEWTDSLPTR